MHLRKTLMKNIIFFLDPPFADNNFIKNLKFIKDKGF